MFTKVEVLRYMTYTLLCGFGLNSAFNMARQDTMGLEGYIEYMRLAWVNTPVWLGWVMMALFAVSLSAAYRRVVNKKELPGLSLGGTAKVDRMGRLYDMELHHARQVPEDEG